MRVELINGGETVDARPISEEKFPWIKIPRRKMVEWRQET